MQKVESEKNRVTKLISARRSWNLLKFEQNLYQLLLSVFSPDFWVKLMTSLGDAKIVLSCDRKLLIDRTKSMSTTRNTYARKHKYDHLYILIPIFLSNPATFYRLQIVRIYNYFMSNKNLPEWGVVEFHWGRLETKPDQIALIESDSR